MLPEIIIFSPKLISGGFYRWSRAYRLRFPAQSDDAEACSGVTAILSLLTHPAISRFSATSAATFFIVVLNYCF